MPPRRRPYAKKKKTYTRRRAPTRRRARRPPNNGRMILYKAPHNALFPTTWVTKLRSRYSGAFPVGTMAGGVLNIPIRGNDAYRPFFGFPTAASTTWMNGVSPLALSATNFEQLCQVDYYQACIVLATKIVLYMNPADNNSDAVIATITPTNTLSGANPATVTDAMKQPFTRFKEFHGQGSGPVPLKFFIKWSKFLGVSSKVYANDAQSVYSHFYNSSPTNALWTVINLATLDCVAPFSPMPFTYCVTHYVKFFKFSAAQIIP